ncbi:MAG: hypothetical protein QXZ44_05480 [Ferroplasma sp.]
MKKNDLAGSTIVVDGSNVAQYGGQKPASFMHIKKMLETLKEDGASKIIIICDANLRHIIDDKDAFNEMLATNEIIMSPAGIKADKFIIDYARRNNALIVTDDKFREYKTDKWVSANIDKITIGFMFIEDDLILEAVDSHSISINEKKKEKKKGWHLFRKN